MKGKVSKFKCKADMLLDDVGPICFKKDKVYRKVKPKGNIYPSVESKICLRDEQKDDHFMDGKFLRKHFTPVAE